MMTAGAGGSECGDYQTRDCLFRAVGTGRAAFRSFCADSVCNAFGEFLQLCILCLEIPFACRKSKIENDAFYEFLRIYEFFGIYEFFAFSILEQNEPMCTSSPLRDLQLFETDPPDN